MPKRLIKTADKKLWGVAGGLADYFNIDPTLVRVGFVVLFFICAPASLVGYITLGFLMPTPSAAAEVEHDSLIENLDPDAI